MPDPSDTTATPSLAHAVERAEALLDRLSHGVRDAAAAVRNSVSAASDRLARPSTAPPSAAPPGGGEQRPAMDRAADIVDTLGRRASAWYESASLTVRRSAALAREEAEDIVADAQALRHGTP